MAIWQYQLNIIPKKAILEKYGKIPDTLFIDFINWKIYWENVTYDNGYPEPNFEDARTIKWWNNIKLDIKKTSEQIDQYVTRGDWNDDGERGFIGWKGNSEKEEDNDAHIAYDKKTNIISEFQFRTDLRNKENAMKFLNGMLNVCSQNDLMVLNTEGILFEPQTELIFEDIKNSNAVKFFSDPIEFLEKIGKEEDKRKLKEDSFWSKIKALLE
ncbi:hypothetical protein [Lacinutrix algicola]|uniref:hypothetical protein n=1 Tax=Lacinutrix algicola TaxID=342954 RepID=UPI0006E191FF|nr:hypothetical protein [Lacinutrix algicola]